MICRIEVVAPATINNKPANAPPADAFPMPTRLDRWVCTDCASRRWKLTDRAFLEAVGIRFDSDMERLKYK
jgi:hypothetical protein